MTTDERLWIFYQSRVSNHFNGLKISIRFAQILCFGFVWRKAIGSFSGLLKGLTIDSLIFRWGTQTIKLCQLYM